MTTKKPTKKITTGAKTARKTTAPMETRVKAETRPAAKVEAAVTESAPVAKVEAVASTPAPVAKVEAVVASKPATVVKVAAAAAPVVVVAAPATKLVAQHEVTALVREAAFLFAKRRNFRNGTPTQDWLAAEAFVNERLAARGFTVSA